MKKKTALLISAVAVIVVIIFSFKEFPSLHHPRTIKYIKPTKAIVVKNLNVNVGQYLKTDKNNVPIYESLDGKLFLIATLAYGQEINSKEEYDHKWYEVRIGNNYGFIPKQDAVISANSQHLNDDLNKNPIIKSYITLENTPVFNNYRRLDRMANLFKEERYPMSVFDKNWLTIDIAGKIGYVKRSFVKIDYGIPVLAYHHFLEKGENKLFRKSSTTITPEVFNQQMGYLHQQHFTSITTGDLTSYLNGKLILPEKTVVITFDDGLQSVYRYAYPILKKYNLKATEFMITGRISMTPRIWNPNKLAALSYPEMAKMRDVFEFNSHTNNLHILSKKKKSALVTMPYNFVKADIALSQKIVHAHSFAYPFGQYNNKVIQILKELGFKSAFTTTPGYAKMGDNPLLIPRVVVTPKISLPLFKNLVNL